MRSAAASTMRSRVLCPFGVSWPAFGMPTA
jgi:hypothetical protein